MKSIKLAEKRHSTREYKDKKLSSNDQDFLMRALKELSETFKDKSIEFYFFEDGLSLAPKINGLAGYFGHMVVAPHYFIVLCDSKPACLKMTGYKGEELILKALENNIGTCWIEVKDSDAVKKIIGFDGYKNIAAMIAVGYSQKEYQHSRIYAQTGGGSLSSLTDLGYPNIDVYHTQGPISSRKPITDFVYDKTWGNMLQIEDLEKLGLHEAFFYMRLAPSYENRQPWHFVIHPDHIDLVIDDAEHISKTIQYIDAGIAMLYFEVGLHESGIRGSWDFSEKTPEYDLPEGVTWVGRYHF